MGRKVLYRNLALTFLLLGVLGHFTAPAFLGFSVIPLFLAILFFLAVGSRQWRKDLAAVFSPTGRSYALVLTIFLLSLAAMLALGHLKLSPVLDYSGNRAIDLAPETLALLDRLDKPVKITIHIGPQSLRREQIQKLMDLYLLEAGDKLSISYVNPQTETVNNGEGPRLVAPETALVESGEFRENISPISEEAIYNTLGRLLHPERRLVYFLNTFGEKMVQDQGPGGLSQWAADLGRRRVLALDYYWPEGQPLPREASALVLAGPKAPLGEQREEQLKEYVRNGGRLMVMADPLTIHLSPDFWALFGLKYPEGLVIDPEATLVGTDDAFVVSHDYPRHALNLGLSSPSVWPITGAFIPGDNEGHTDLDTTIFAVAMSSPSSWLESDAVSFINKDVRYQPDSDIPGPLALAIAAELSNGGRLLALADSDLAVNGFQGFAGNRNFTSAALNWLLDGEAIPLKMRDESKSLMLSHISARLIFWLPAVVWPALVILLWLIFYFGRHGRRRQAD